MGSQTNFNWYSYCIYLDQMSLQYLPIEVITSALIPQSNQLSLLKKNPTETHPCDGLPHLMCGLCKINWELILD